MRRPVGVLVAIGIVLFGLELALPSSGHLPPGTSAAFGLIGCVVIVAVAKLLGGLGLQRVEPADD